MNEIQVIEQQKILTKDFRVYGAIERPLFLAADIVEWLEYDPIGVNEILFMIAEYKGEACFLTEEGLYEVLLKSDYLLAKQFKKQVNEILSDLRLYGKYDVKRAYAQALELALK